MIAAAVDWDALLGVVLASILVGVGITIAFSLAIVGSTRFAEHRRSGGRGERVAYGALALGALTITMAAVVGGIAVMMSK